MKILNNYQAYPQPKKGIFELNTDEYKLPGGWVQKKEERMIIGEDNNNYVYSLHPANYYWNGDIMVEIKCLVPHGIHKSRFVRWLDNQLALF